jgi:hypothetical protein
MDDLELMERAVKLDTFGKKMLLILMQESLAKDAAILARVEGESDDNQAIFDQMASHGLSLNKRPTISGLLDDFISYNSGKEFQREHIVLTLHLQAIQDGLKIEKNVLSKRLTKLVKSRGITTRREGLVYYWTMP